MNLNLKFLKEACKNQKIDFKALDENSNFIEVSKNGKSYFFIHHGSPFNDQSTHQICLDKEFCYLLLNDVINMPFTKGYLDPNTKEKNKKYLRYKNLEAIENDMLKKFNLPFVIKRNRGSKAQNSFLIKTEKNIIPALKRVFAKKVDSYDYIALAQEMIDIKKEFRVIVLNKKIELVYEKNSANFIRKFNKLEKSEHKIVEDKKFLKRLEEFIKPIYSKLNLNFGGLDIALDKDNNLWLIEINNNPGYAAFLKDNGKESLVKVYEKALINLF